MDARKIRRDSDDIVITYKGYIGINGIYIIKYIVYRGIENRIPCIIIRRRTDETFKSYSRTFSFD